MRDLTLASAVAEPAPLAPIVQPYLLVLYSVPIYVDGAGRRWLEPLWAKDLIAHTEYLKDLTLVTRAAQVSGAAMPADAVAIDEVAALSNVRFAEVPMPSSGFEALRQLPQTCRVLWRELRRARIVHTAVAAWPFPEAWPILPMLRLRPRLLYINVESAFWRLAPGAKASWRQTLRAGLLETLNRACIGRADISTFTHAGYRSSLLRRSIERGHVVEASWIDDEKLLSNHELARAVALRHRAGLRLVFAGRINREKGILVLIEAVARCLQAGLGVSLDVYGDGPLRSASVARAEELGAAAAITFRGSVPYDARFFDALRGYDALVVPSLTDEQPRIVFDAYSQGLPVIASRTEGLLQCVQQDVTGLLCDPGDVPALQALLARAVDEPHLLSDLSGACLERARGLTHRAMHRKRWQLLVSAFPELARATQTPSPASAPRPA
jgi:glycosyltransferase involved in cell wall biosynthesis